MSQVTQFRATIQAKAPVYRVELNQDQEELLCKYYRLVLAWNPRLHLVGPCAPAEFATRHVLESLLLLPYLSFEGTIVDIGSGAGLPIIPCLIAKPQMSATLIEASKKKAVFLREAIKGIGIDKRAKIIADRFENIVAPRADFLTCRALERFKEMVPRLLEWAPANCSLLLFGGENLRLQLDAAGRDYDRVSVPNSARRYLFVVNGEW